MGREIKRVALNFDWPLNKVWEGFLLPENLQGRKCTDCQGGQTHAGWWIQAFSQRISMLGTDIRDQKLGKPMHPWLLNDQYPHGHWEGDGPYGTNKYVVDRPSDDILDLFVGLSRFLGKDTKPQDFTNSLLGTDSYLIFRVLAKAAGLDGDWDKDSPEYGPSFGRCTTCNGEGYVEEYEGQFAERDEWNRYDHEPPTGEGWQVWETTSEGSPISPVFADREGCIQWLMSPAYNRGMSRSLTREQAENFTENAWAPTMIFTPQTGLIPGEQYVGRKEEQS